MLRPLSSEKTRAMLQREAYFSPAILTASRRWMENVNCGSVETKCSTLCAPIAVETKTASHPKAVAQMHHESNQLRSSAISILSPGCLTTLRKGVGRRKRLPHLAGQDVDPGTWG